MVNGCLRIMFIPDDAQLRSVFEKDTAFLYRHDNNAFSWMEPITEFLGVKKLSESVEFSMMNCGESKNREQNKLITPHTCWMICYAIKNIGTDGDDDLQQLIEDQTIRDLFSLREQTITNLQASGFTSLMLKSGWIEKLLLQKGLMNWPILPESSM